MFGGMCSGMCSGKLRGSPMFDGIANDAQELATTGIALDVYFFGGEVLFDVTRRYDTTAFAEMLEFAMAFNIAQEILFRLFEVKDELTNDVDVMIVGQCFMSRIIMIVTETLCLCAASDGIEWVERGEAREGAIQHTGRGIDGTVLEDGSLTEDGGIEHTTLEITTNEMVGSVISQSEMVVKYREAIVRSNEDDLAFREESA